MGKNANKKTKQNRGEFMKDCVHKFVKINGFQEKCIKCNNIRTKCEVYSRVVGYIRPVDNWSDSKQSEFKDRHLHKE